MENNIDFEALPELIKNLISGNEMKNIMDAVKKDDAPTEKTAESFTLPPDIMEKLPLVMSALTSGMPSTNSEDAPAANSNNQATDIAANLPNVLSALSGISKSGKAPELLSRVAGDKNRKALLSALKPYMGERKKAAIDTMLSFNTLAEIMSSLISGSSNSN